MTLAALVFALSPWGQVLAPPAQGPTDVAVTHVASLHGPSSTSDDTADEEERRKEASEAFARGVEAYKAEQYETALQEFSRAQRLAPHPDTQYNIGLSQQHNGAHLDAWETFSDLLHTSSDTAEREDIIVARANSRPHIVILRVQTDPDSQVCFDGAALTPAPSGQRQRLTTPGEHSLDVDGHRRTLKLHGGETRTIEIGSATALGRSAPPRRPLRVLAGLAIGSTIASGGLGLAAGLSDRPRLRRDLGIGSAAAGTVALTSTIIALAIHRRARRRPTKSPPRPTECSGPLP